MNGTAARRTPLAMRSSLNAARRERELDELAAGEVVDVLVIGGGITGAGVALDAATRGLTVALIERRDLANGTSRWSSKLVHGGLRYLATGDVGLAYESAHERGILMERTAPHLTRPLALVAPVGVGFRRRDAAATALGFTIANGLRAAAGTRRETLPRPRWIGAGAAGRLTPAIRRHNLDGALLSWDGQLVDDARLVVAVARTAAAFGARILTYCEALTVDGDGARVRDSVAGDELVIRARHVVNATGVWADRLDANVRLRPSKGVHLIVRGERLGNPTAQLAAPVPGMFNRFVILLPQADGRVLLGLTDDPAEEVSDDPAVDEGAIRFLLDTANHVLQSPLTTDDVVGAFAGLRPLLAKEGGATSDLSRRHRIIEADSGLLTIVGGKLTTYRRMAEHVVDRIAARGVVAGPCVTARQPLVGALPRQRLASLPAAPLLVRRYGAEALDIEALIAGDVHLGAPVAPGSPHRLAELVWAARHEGALTVADLLDRRTRIGLVAEDREAAVEAAASVVAGEGLPAAA